MKDVPENCPVCGEILEMGYLCTGHRLRWSEDKPNFWIKKGYSEKVEAIAGGQ